MDISCRPAMAIHFTIRKSFDDLETGKAQVKNVFE
jgi:hypothetical protein